MPGLFDEIEVGSQVVLTADRSGGCFGVRRMERDPSRIVRIAVVTHLWSDPVEEKDFVGLAYVKADGAIGETTLKHTRRGLAQNGWRPADRDWIAQLRARAVAVGDGSVVNIWRRRRNWT